MFNCNIIIILILLKMLSIFYAHHYMNTKIENKICNCMTIEKIDFMICWIKYTIDITNYSKAIIKNLTNFNKFSLNLENTKKELFEKFYNVYKDKQLLLKFISIINLQIDIRLNLSFAIKNEQVDKFNKLTNLLQINTDNLIILFTDIIQNKNNKIELQQSINTHKNLLLKSLNLMKTTTNAELSRELILSSISTMKLLL